MTLRVLCEAEAEMEQARRWLNQQSSGLGGRFLKDLASVFVEIKDHPLNFPRLETLPDDWPYRRALLKTFRYAVIFETFNEEILVVAIAHSSREPNYWLDR